VRDSEVGLRNDYTPLITEVRRGRKELGNLRKRGKGAPKSTLDGDEGSIRSRSGHGPGLREVEGRILGKITENKENISPRAKGNVARQ